MISSRTVELLNWRQVIREFFLQLEKKAAISFPLARLSSELTRQDAFKRIERLEELRAKIREERQRTVMGAHASVPWLGTMVLCNQRWGTSPGAFGLAKKISWQYICVI